MTGCEAPEAMKPEAKELKGKAVIAIQSFTKNEIALTALGWHVFLMARAGDCTPMFLTLAAERNGAAN